MAAAEVMRQALELAPTWPAGWSLLADYFQAANDQAGAVAALERLCQVDRAGTFGARLRLAALGSTVGAGDKQEAYVTALFDDYAPRFDAALQRRLHYVVPERLAAMIEAELARRGTGRLGHAIDLGCGTGLMGERLRRHASFLEGVDLSAGMVAEAARKGIYDRLETGEMTTRLATPGQAADIVTAADVFCYWGALAPVFAAVATRLRAGGLFAFSVERHDGPEPFVVRPSLRFAHEEGALVADVRRAGLAVISCERAVLRCDRGEPVAGLLVLAERPSSEAGRALPAGAPVEVGRLRQRLRPRNSPARGAR